MRTVVENVLVIYGTNLCKAQGRRRNVVLLKFQSMLVSTLCVQYDFGIVLWTSLIFDGGLPFSVSVLASFRM